MPLTNVRFVPGVAQFLIERFCLQELASDCVPALQHPASRPKSACSAIMPSAACTGYARIIAPTERHILRNRFKVAHKIFFVYPFLPPKLVPISFRQTLQIRSNR